MLPATTVVTNIPEPGEIKVKATSQHAKHLDGIYHDISAKSWTELNTTSLNTLVQDRELWTQSPEKGQTFLRLPIL